VRWYEFKAQAVKRLLEGGRGLSEVATELGTRTSTATRSSKKPGTTPHVWTGTYPAGNNGGGQLPNCQDWTSDSASDIGTGGNMIETNAGFTTGLQDSCDQSHHVLCVQFGFE
jgi:hypothetical protein